MTGAAPRLVAVTKWVQFLAVSQSLLLVGPKTKQGSLNSTA
ncbi:hypothetical protein PCIT_a1530 [Pseudoalteromonas citrea]|uniref:Uncharacterized protein n=1 Tax=Pseudoalteromonas citrea TaxID=43655 RepID=A0AAD4AMF1_9GAMM|nr:hypothetical protein PCIT_a1530 [Pseudoalteromonas citrea]